MGKIQSPESRRARRHTNFIHTFFALKFKRANHPLLPHETPNTDLKILKRELKKQVLAFKRYLQRQNYSVREVSEFLGLNASTLKGWETAWRKNKFRSRPCGRPQTTISEFNSMRDAVLEVLHAPPSAYGVNRTSWKCDDIRAVIRRKNCLVVSDSRLRQIIKQEGYCWRKAKIVLTSNDPEYRQKLDHIKSILSSLKPDERFFSIDEYGPFAVKMKPGKKLVFRGERPTVPQFQKSKGCLILTAALELSENQVTHFYSQKKNMREMITLLDLLIERYSDCKKLYLSWDAASWHASKELFVRVEALNAERGLYAATPKIELVPLPASAQFLNVIESVFSGMARAIIHNSDYQSIDQAKQAIDRYFEQRNAHFRTNPKKAGNKIWGKELVPPQFSETQNCKDRRYR